MPDSDGYPLESELEYISNLEIEPDLDKMMEYIKSIWYWPDLIWRSRRGRWTLVTGGWSGNEDIIRALMNNYIFWMFFWESSYRGGRYTFAPARISLMK